MYRAHFESKTNDSSEESSTQELDDEPFGSPPCGSCRCCLDSNNDDCECDARKLVAFNVRRLRHARDLSQEELSARANIHRTHLTRLETQAINVSLGVILKLARALELDPRELLKPRRYHTGD